MAVSRSDAWTFSYDRRRSAVPADSSTAKVCRSTPSPLFAVGERSFVMSICLFVCLCAFPRAHRRSYASNRHQVAYTWYPLPCFGPPLEASRFRTTTLQRNRAIPRGAEGPRDATWCRDRAILETARRYSVQRPRDSRDRATLRRAETARRYVVQRPRDSRDRATLRRADGPRDATACREKSCKSTSFCDGYVDRSTTGRFGPASGRTGRALPIRRALDAGEPTPNTLSVMSKSCFRRPQLLLLGLHLWSDV